MRETPLSRWRHGFQPRWDYKKKPSSGADSRPRDVKGGINGAARSCLPGEDVARQLFLESRQGQSLVGEPSPPGAPDAAQGDGARSPGRRHEHIPDIGRRHPLAAERGARAIPHLPQSPRIHGVSLATSARRACEDAWARPDLKCQGVTITTRPFPKASVVAYSTPSGATSTAAGSVTSTSTDASPSTIWEI
jgi:hypothetical protein